jgi:cystathionine beta-synthase
MIPRAPVFGNILEMIGNTPMLELKRMDTGPCRLFVKMESLNPGNSIKDRIAVRMIEAAEQDGRLKPGGHVVEATAGNTGLALALVAAQKGYTLTVVVPDKMSDEKISHLRAMGAEVVMTRSDVAKGHPEYYQDVAERIAAGRPNTLFINQFANPANAEAHERTTAPEIWEQMEGKVDALVAGVGSGGTISGVGRYLKARNPKVEIVLADPAGSILAPLVNEGKHVDPGSWLVEGIGEDFVPSICDLKLVSKAYTVTDRDAFHTARELLRAEGVLAGSSVVTFICDSGAKYLSKMFNDFWMVDNGFIDRPKTGDLRDLIARRHLDREDYTLTADLPLQQAIKRMRLYNVSQMVVLDAGGRVEGIIDESDVLLAMVDDPRGSATRPVGDFMTRRIETLRPSAKVTDLLPIFRADRVAIVADDRAFYGIITKIDLINYLRKQLL